MPLELVDPRGIRPPHGVEVTRKLKALMGSMSTRGWIGRPLLAIRTADGLKALTGSHRLVAAQKSGMKEVPVYVIDSPGHPVNVPKDDRDWLGFVSRLGDPAATDIMRQETIRRKR